jgi:hypothetical protein
MIIKIYCPGHFRKFTTAAGLSSYNMHFCGGCSKLPKKSLTTLKFRKEQTIMNLDEPKKRTLIKKRDDAYTPRGCLVRSKLATSKPTSSYSIPPYQAAQVEFSNSLMVSLCLAALVVFNVDSLQAVPLDTLRAPMTAMKNEVWSYMFAIKVGAAIVGAIGSAVQSSLTPLGIGAGIAAGIHFFDGVIGDGSAALIGF